MLNRRRAFVREKEMDWTFDVYQKLAWETAIYPSKGDNIYYPTLGLAGEAGEVAEKVKKIMRDKKGEVTEKEREELKKEIGDVLWYVGALCSELNINMGDVASQNIDKLSSRKERGKLQGDGDNR